MFEPKASFPEVLRHQVNNTNSYPNSHPIEGLFPALQFPTFYTEAKYDILTISDGDGIILMDRSVEKVGLKAYSVSKNFGWRCRLPPCNLAICNSGLVFLFTPTHFVPFLSLVFFISLANNNCAISRLFHHIVSFYLP